MEGPRVADTRCASGGHGVPEWWTRGAGVLDTPGRRLPVSPKRKTPSVPRWHRRRPSVRSGYAPTAMPKTCIWPPATDDGSVTLLTVLPASRVIGAVAKISVFTAWDPPPVELRYGVVSRIRLPYDGWLAPPPSVQSEKPMDAVDVVPSV